MLYQLGRIQSTWKMEPQSGAKPLAKSRKAGGEKPLRLFALFSVLCGFKTPLPTRLVHLACYYRRQTNVDQEGSVAVGSRLMADR